MALNDRKGIHINMIEIQEDTFDLSLSLHNEIQHLMSVVTGFQDNGIPLGARLQGGIGKSDPARRIRHYPELVSRFDRNARGAALNFGNQQIYIAGITDQE
jgi:hypothetical protein